ncbi:hypothetical protein DFQ26_001921, partial [Actinomortierella ambigua]
MEGMSLEVLYEKIKSGAPYLGSILRGLLGSRIVGQISEHWPKRDDLYRQCRYTLDSSDQDPHKTVVSLAGILLYKTNRNANALQLLLGLYLKSQRCSQAVTSVISAVGLSVSPSTCQRAFTALSVDSCRLIKEIARDAGFRVIYALDNLDLFTQAHDQGPNRRDTLIHGVTVTMIMFADSVIFDPDAPIFRNQPLPTPTPQHFLEGLQTESQKETTQFHIFDALRRHGCDSGDWIPTLTDIDRLPAQKTETYSLPGLPHGQSTLEGVLAGLEEIVEHSGLSKEHISNRNIIFAGDMFTVDRLRTLKRLRSLD